MQPFNMQERYLIDMYVNHYLQIVFASCYHISREISYRTFLKYMRDPNFHMAKGEPVELKRFIQYLETPVMREEISIRAWTWFVEPRSTQLQPYNKKVLVRANCEPEAMEYIGMTTSTDVSSEHEHLLYLPSSVAGHMMWNEFYPEQDDSVQFMPSNLYLDEP